MKRTLTGLVFMAYGLILAHLLWNNGIRYFLHPKMHMYIYFAMVLFVCSSIAIVALYKSIDIDNFSFVMFMLPLMLFLLFAPTSVQDQFGYSKGVRLGDDAIVYSGDVQSSAELLVQTGSYENVATIGVRADTVTKSAPSNDGYLEITSQTYKHIVQEIVQDPYKYAGYDVFVEGTVIRSTQLPDQTFVISRTLITCCLADATILGILATTEEQDAFFQGNWYSLHGTLSVLEQGTVVYPIITISEYTEIETPEDPYLYR